MVQLYAYEAGKGDFLRIRFLSQEDNMHHNIFVDGGKKPKVTEKRIMTFRKVIEDIAVSCTDIIDAVFVTHWDDDHIEGVLECIDNADNNIIEKIGGLYMNSGIIATKDKHINESSHSAKKAEKLADYLINKQINWIDSVSQEMQTEKGKNPLYEIAGAKLWIISPGNDQLETLKKYDSRVFEVASGIEHGQTITIPKSFEEEYVTEIYNPDKSETNGSSTAFIFEYEDVRIAFLGDAFPEVCVDGLRKLGYSIENPCKVDIIKIPHHGSIRNYSKELYQILDTDNYLVCTNGPVNCGNLLPNKSCLVHLLLDMPHQDNRINLYCNYSWWNNSTHSVYFQNDKNIKLNPVSSSETNEQLNVNFTYKGMEYLMNIININDVGKILNVKDKLEISSCR